MEIHLNQNTNHTELNGSSADNKKFVTNMVVNRKPLREWGFEQAGLNRGDAMALESHLRWIKEGHLVDETNSAEEEMTKKSQLEEQMMNKEKERGGKEKDIAHLKDVVIRAKEVQIEKYKDEIAQLQIQMAEGTIRSEYSAARFWLYVVLCIFISVFVLFFYASAINASFFRSMQQLVNSGNDITLMLNSIFDVNGIMNFGPQSVFTYLGAFIFFGFGLLPHIFHHQKTKFSGWKVAAAIIVCLLIDSLLAYKIDSGIHELKQMMGIGDPTWNYYESVNFYLVLSFGFGTYLLWGFIYEAALAERKKQDTNACTEIKIYYLNRSIRKIEHEIVKDKKELSVLQKQVEALRLDVEKLKKDLEAAALRPEELLRNMENFYLGWLGYLNGIAETNNNKAACETVYRSFYKSLQQQVN